MDKVKILIDGSNFFYYCKEIRVPTYPKFDFEKLSKLLAQGRTITEKSYYIGGVRANPKDHKAMKMMKKQMSFFAYLKRNGWNIRKGYLLKSNGKHHEKGVDVLLALDLALGAVDNNYDTALLVSSDTDLLPAIKETEDRGKKVEYIGFSHRPSIAMVSNCKMSRLITKADLINCCV
jgi:uncharacterized LabA/DUF88 family protein